MLQIAGSTALILFAIRLLRKGVDRLLGTKLGSWSSTITNGSGRGFIFGTLMATSAPSSTSMAAVTTRLALEERVTPFSAFALMLGTNIGLTSLVLIGAAGIEMLYPLLVLIGVLLFQFTSKGISRGIGQIVLSLGFILLGMHLTKQAIPAFRGGDAETMIGLLGHHVLILAMLSALLTLVVQSSSITILLLICLADRHPFTMSAVMAAVAGANIGLVVTSLGISWKESRSRLPALAVAAIKVVVSILIIAAAVLTGSWSGGAIGDAHMAATVHVLIALLTAAIGFLIGRPLLAWLATTPLSRSADQSAAPRYLDLEVGGDIRLAMGKSQREILRVSEKARAMLEQVWQAWSRGDHVFGKSVSQLDDQIDNLDRDIKAFLARTSSSDQSVHREQICQLRYVTQLEAIGDMVEKQLVVLVNKGIRYAPDMSPRSRQLLDDTCQSVLRTLLTAETAFSSRDPVLAERLLVSKTVMGELSRSERDASLERLREGASHEAEVIYLDLLAVLQRINSSACAVAYDILPARDREDEPAVTARTA